MAASEDSRPFTVLKQNAEDFKASFDENVTQCLATFDSKITQLLVGQESASSSFKDARRLTAHMEFSKAKLEVFSSMKDMINQMEASWIDQLSELKETFIENIEIFLAGTKLEMKDDSLSHVGNKSVSSLKGRKSYQNTPSPTVSSLYPTFINTAKHIPGIDSTPQNLKPIRKLPASPPMKDTPGQNARKKNSVRFMEENTETIIIDDEIEMEDEVEEIVSVGTPVRPGRGSRKSILSTPASSKKNQGTPLGKRNAARTESSDSSDSSSSDDKAVVTSIPEKEKETPARRGRRSKNQPVVPEPEVETSEESTTNKVSSLAGPNTPKNVHFSLGLDVNEDLEIYSPQIDLTRSVPRRKTTVNPVLDPLPDFSLTPDFVSVRSKRKTFGGDISEISVAPSPKRFKKGRSSIAPSTLAMETKEAQGSDLLDDEEASGKDNYTPWIPLSDVGAKVPTQPGVYELKVLKAKKPAFIGSCESLRQKLTLHKLKHNSGHKHLDKFVERNAVNILVRFEIMPSISDAITEEKARIKTFVSQFNTTPAYN